jgi:hypothetical protein
MLLTGSSPRGPGVPRQFCQPVSLLYMLRYHIYQMCRISVATFTATSRDYTHQHHHGALSPAGQLAEPVMTPMFNSQAVALTNNCHRHHESETFIHFS